MTRSRRQPRGIALMLVITALALASALGYVMLSSAALQNRAGGNQSRLATAEYLAESGINLALIYLQSPEKAPPLQVNASGYWGGTSGAIALSSTIPGTVNVTVTRDATDVWSYEIVSTATAGTQAETVVSKTAGARVYVRNEYQTKHASVFNRDTTIVPYINIQGDVWSSKNFGIRTGTPTSSVTGTVYCKTPLTGPLYRTPTGGWGAVPNDFNPAPSLAATLPELNYYATYSIADVAYSAETITASSLGAVTMNKSATNPGGVFIKTGDLDLNANTVINGTLVVKGNVRVRGANVVITAESGFPGLICTGTLQIDQSKNSLLVNGICYVGSALRSSGSLPALPADNSTFTVDGSLLIGNTSSSNIVTPYNVTTLIKYNAAKAKAPDLSPVQRTPTGVSIVRWGLP